MTQQFRPGLALLPSLLRASLFLISSSSSISAGLTDMWTTLFSDLLNRESGQLVFS
jgi:hypothetical protein